MFIFKVILYVFYVPMVAMIPYQSSVPEKKIQFEHNVAKYNNHNIHQAYQSYSSAQDRVARHMPSNPHLFETNTQTNVWQAHESYHKNLTIISDLASKNPTTVLNAQMDIIKMKTGVGYENLHKTSEAKVWENCASNVVKLSINHKNEIVLLSPHQQHESVKKFIDFVCSAKSNADVKDFFNKLGINNTQLKEHESMSSSFMRFMGKDVSTNEILQVSYNKDLFALRDYCTNQNIDAAIAIVNKYENFYDCDAENRSWKHNQLKLYLESYICADGIALIYHRDPKICNYINTIENSPDKVTTELKNRYNTATQIAHSFGIDFYKAHPLEIKVCYNFIDLGPSERQAYLVELVKNHGFTDVSQSPLKLFYAENSPLRQQISHNEIRPDTSCQPIAHLQTSYEIITPQRINQDHQLSAQDTSSANFFQNHIAARDQASTHQMQSTVEKDVSSFQKKLPQYSQAQNYYEKNCPEVAARLTKQIGTIKDINSNGMQYENKAYILSDKAREVLQDANIDNKQYSQCYGNQLQQVIHDQCVSSVERISQLPAISPLFSYKKSLVYCVDGARNFNQQGLCYKAITINNFCYAVMEYGKAAIEGVGQGIVHIAQNAVDHPIQTLAYAVAGKYVLAYQLGKVLADITEIGVTSLTDPALGRQQWAYYIKPVTDLIDAISLRQITIGQAIKEGSQFATELYAENRLLTGLSRLCKVARFKAVEFAKANNSVSPQAYVQTPEGQLFNAMIQKDKQKVAAMVNGIPKREIVLPRMQTYEQARNKALEIIGDVDWHTGEAYMGRIHSGKGKVVGRQWHKGKVRIRLDYDPIKGPHINLIDFRQGKGSNGMVTAIPFHGTQDSFISLLRHLQ